MSGYGYNYFTHKGIRIRYEESGGGEPLILITGLGGDLLFWRSAVRLLSDSFHIITFDNRGSGETTCPDNDFNMADMANDVAYLLDHLGIEKVHLMGWSMGGNIAQEFTLLYPQKVATLTLASTYLRRPCRSSYAIDNIIAVGEKMGEDMVMPLMNALCMSEEYYAQQEKGIRPNENGRRVYNIEGLRRQKFALDSHDVSERISEINVPVLIFHGEDDIMVPIRFGEEMARKIYGSEMIRIPTAGHILRADQYVPHLKKFLKLHPIR